MEFAREWTAFGGASLALMGAALAAGARRNASDIRSWRRQWREAVGAAPAPEPGADRLVGTYRAVGGIVALVGGVLAAAVAAGFVAPASTPGAGPRALGAGVAALGLAFAVRKATAESRGPKFLETGAFAAGEKPLDARAADALAWALCALWMACGLRWFGGTR